LRSEEISATAVSSQAVVGGGAAPGVTLLSAAVRVPGELATPLRTGQPSVVGRAEGDWCLLDLRTVATDDDDAVMAAVIAAATGQAAVKGTPADRFASEEA
jgi:L-seryl-tRNA(Ser) seleniumtransferase